LGNGYYGGVAYTTGGKLVTVSAGSMLAQQIKKILTENKRPSGYGFDYTMIGNVVTPSTIPMIRSEVIRCISYLRFVQQNNKQNGFFYNPNEELDSIGTLNIQPASIDPRQVIVTVTVYATSGRPVNLSTVVAK
jgi:hypothetical protein